MIRFAKDDLIKLRRLIKERSVVDRATGCWFWTGSKQSMGYGNLTFRNKSFLAHRLAYLAFRENRELSRTDYIMHSCDNPGCINPNHLSIGSQNDNMMDCSRKGRTYRGGAKNPRRGIAHHATRLCEADIIAIRNDPRTQRELAQAYNISQGTVSNIKCKRSWSHL